MVINATILDTINRAIFAHEGRVNPTKEITLYEDRTKEDYIKAFPNVFSDGIEGLAVNPLIII